MSLNDYANRAAVLHLLADAFTSAAKEEKTHTLNEMFGRGTLHPTLPDGTEIATVNVPAASARVSVTDDRALAQWVAEHYPSEVETVPVVRPAFLQRLKDVSKLAGEPCAPDGTLDIPGLDVESRPPQSARVTPTEQGRNMAQGIVEHVRGASIPHLAAQEIGGEQR